MNDQPFVSALHIYPVKSCHAVDVASAYAGPRGFVAGKVLDRGWMIVDEQGVLVSQRTEPSLARVRVDLVNGPDGMPDRISLSALGRESIILDPAAVGDEKQRVIIHGKETVGHVAPVEISQWFSGFLGKTIGAVYQKDDDVRRCDPDFALEPDYDEVSFADGYPFLVANKGTLDLCNSFMQTPVPMQRFRPNIEIGGAEPQAEYTWRAISVGDAVLNFVKPCVRCVMTTIDQEEGARTGKEPLAVLSRTAFLDQDFARGHVRGAIFGENAVPTEFGTVSVGDAVHVLADKPIYRFGRPAQEPRP